MPSNRPSYTASTRRLAWLAAIAAAGITLAGCDRPAQDSTVGQKVDKAIERTEQAAREGAQDARSAVGAATDAARDAGEKAVVVLDDTAITAAVSAGLAKDPDLSALRVDVETKNGVVTLQGPAPSETARTRASEIALGVKGVSSVNNQLVVRAS